MLERIFEAVSSVNTDKLILQYLANNPKATAAQMADFFAYYAKVNGKTDSQTKSGRQAMAYQER